MYLLPYFVLFTPIVSGLYMASDRSPQEIALADWSMGVQMPYCPQIPLVDMIEPFVDAVVKMINRYCQNPDNCDLVKRSSSYSSDEGWLVSGATGGKNAALQRTLEIIEEQKYHHEQERRLQMAIERKEALAARIKLAEAGHGELVPNVERIVPGATKTDSTESETTQETDNNLYEDELADTVPEIVIMPARNSIDSNAPHRKVRKGRRLSSYEEAKRKSWGNIGQNNDKKRWKAGSLMLRTFGSKN